MRERKAPLRPRAGYGGTAAKDKAAARKTAVTKDTAKAEQKAEEKPKKKPGPKPKETKDDE